MGETPLVNVPVHYTSVIEHLDARFETQLLEQHLHLVHFGRKAALLLIPRHAASQKGLPQLVYDADLLLVPLEPAEKPGCPDTARATVRVDQSCDGALASCRDGSRYTSGTRAADAYVDLLQDWNLPRRLRQSPVGSLSRMAAILSPHQPTRCGGKSTTAQSHTTQKPSSRRLKIWHKFVPQCSSG